jgi:hypothetical protein
MITQSFFSLLAIASTSLRRAHSASQADAAWGYAFSSCSCRASAWLQQHETNRAGEDVNLCALARAKYAQRTRF